MSTKQKSIIFVHGWLGNPSSFGHLPRIFEAEGHDVLPIFKHYDTRTRSLTLEERADAFESEFKATVKDPNKRHIIVAHSMGGLLIRTWMLRHYFQKGKKPPVEKVIECGSPRNGVPSDAFGDLMVRWKILPGSKLVGQMKAAQTFIWNLAWAELEFASQWPTTLAITSILKHSSIVARLIGGRESDSIVPATLSNPNPIFARLGQPNAVFKNRPFRIFYNWAHNGSKGLLGHIRSNSQGIPINPNDDVLQTIKGYVNGTPTESPDHFGQPAHDILTRTFLLVRIPPESSASPITKMKIEITSGIAEPGISVPPLSHTQQKGFGLFEFPPPSPKRDAMHFNLRSGKHTWSDKDCGLEEGVLPGQYVYLDLQI